MRKEVLIAVVIGAILGSLFAFGVWRANSALNGNGEKTAEVESDKQESTDTPSDLNLAKPTNYSVLIENTASIEGITSPNAIVVAHTDSQNIITKANSNGEFTTEVGLVPGVNLLKVSSYDSTKKIKEESLKIVYSEEIYDNVGGETPEDRLDRATNPPIAILGTITDITDISLQVQNGDDQIEQISLSEKTSYTNIVKEQTEIDIDELAIGDYVAAIGFKSSDNDLDARRIIVTIPLEETQTKVIYGQVIELSSSDFLVLADDQQWSIDAKGQVDVTTLSEGEISTIRFAQIDPEDTIIVIGTVDEDTGELDAVRVHLVNKASTPEPETTE